MQYDFSGVEQYLNELQTLGVPDGYVIVKRKGETLFRGGFGSNPQNKRFFLYSCSKLMTVTGMLLLIEKGKAGLDDPVEKYLPAFHDICVEEGEGTVPPNNTMTLRHLFTMTAGLDYDRTAPAIVQAAATPGATTKDIVSAFAKKPLHFHPGERFRYSWCHDVLSGVIESITGKTFAAYMQEAIFTPLGMNRTSYTFRDEEMAPQYTFIKETRCYDPMPLTCCYMLSGGYYSGGAGIVSTVDDLSLFTDALVNGKLLKAETIRMMRADQLKAIAKDSSFTCAAGPGYSYGLGVRTLVDRSNGQKSPIGEFGWDGAVGSYELCDVENGVSIAFVMHVMNWPDIRETLHAPLRDAVYTALRLD